MAVKAILSDNQLKLLRLLGKEKLISKNFYLTGGTALAQYYLKHRLSEDLDFFSEAEFNPKDIAIELKKIQKEAGIKRVDFQQSFNRNLFFLELKNDVIKTEFTYFPFPPVIARSLKATEAIPSYGSANKEIAALPTAARNDNALLVDTLMDIAVNKIFTIYQNPRSRDFIDLYFIIQKTGWKIIDLVKKAKIKFDWHVDPLQLGSQFMRVNELKDYPRMIKKLDHKKWQGFFIKEAKKLGSEIIV